MTTLHATVTVRRPTEEVLGVRREPAGMDVERVRPPVRGTAPTRTDPGTTTRRPVTRTEGRAG